MVIYIFTFPPLNVNWTFKSDASFNFKFCCPKPQSFPKSHYIPEGILTSTYVKMLVYQPNLLLLKRGRNFILQIMLSPTCSLAKSA